MQSLERRQQEAGQQLKADVPKQEFLRKKTKRYVDDDIDERDVDKEDVENTKALEVHYEKEPQEFVNIGSENYQRLPQIDQARVFLLKNSPKSQFKNENYLKTYLLQSFQDLKMDDPIALNKTVNKEKNEERERALLEAKAQELKSRPITKIQYSKPKQEDSEEGNGE